MSAYTNVHEVHPNLFLGAHPTSAADLAGRFDAVLDVHGATSAEQQAAYAAHGISYRGWVMEDGVVPSERSGSFEARVKWLRERVEDGDRVLLHCAAGVSRSASIAALYLMRVEGLDAAEALARLKGARPQVDPHRRFVIYLHSLTQR